MTGRVCDKEGCGKGAAALLKVQAVTLGNLEICCGFSCFRGAPQALAARTGGRQIYHSFMYQ